jgi:hypothetical protein
MQVYFFWDVMSCPRIQGSPLFLNGPDCADNMHFRNARRFIPDDWDFPILLQKS